ncbi:hypothetical protein ALC62_12418 [Cyphomyrmex costatus]|uniref:Mutator-like transposase domain-containing protein n=1 Tax=Cyphomyrmex costatus TaxID=456900 RepID=A0A151IBN1_9HYME|nr:hypothetical protein ALC62_12418 [Cyphomyrmex costatus]
MDRKGKRHEVGKSTERADRKRKRFGPVNRYETEKPNLNISTSSKKLSSFGETNVTVYPNISYRIINFITVFSTISEYIKCKTCKGDVEFCEGNKRGLGFKIILKCKSCVPKEINSCPLVQNAYEIWQQEHENQCAANHTGSAGKMEPDAMLEIFQRANELYGMKYVNYIGDGNSKTYSKIIEQLPYDVQKKECINHVQKRMGTRLRNRKKNEKGLSGKGKLTENLTKDLTLYYSLAIRRNSDFLENMKKAIWATFFHKCSTDEKPQHDNCPTGKDSWCKWQKARALGNLDIFTHEPAMPEAVSKAIKSIYEDLSRDDLLQRCLGAFNQNNNKSFNQIIWKIAPKSLFSDTHIVQIAANIARILFNNGHVALLDVLELLHIKIGQTVYDYCHYVDEERVRIAEGCAYANTHESRLNVRITSDVDKEAFLDVEELLYGPGIAE